MILLKNLVSSLYVFWGFKATISSRVTLKFNSLLFVFIGVACFNQVTAQQQCYTVVDSLTFEPIPYCNILFHENGFVSNHLGQLCISDVISINDTLIISNIAYSEKAVALNDLVEDTLILLSPKKYQMQSIDIKWSDFKFYWRGNHLNNADGYKQLWHACHTGLLILPIKNKNCILETVKIKVKNTAGEKLPIRLHVFAIDSMGNPANELLPVNLYASLVNTNLGYVQFNVLPYQIVVPESGIYVTVELLSNKRAVLLKNNSFQTDKYTVENRIAMTKARFRHRDLLKVSSWKPGSFYIESYPFTNILGYYGNLPIMKVKLRRIQ